MQLSKSKKRLLIIFGSIIGIIFIVIFVINQMAATLIEGKIQAALDKNNSEYHIKIKDVGGNIFFGNIRLKNIEITPDSSFLQSVKNGEAPTSTAFELNIPLLRLVGVGMYDAIVHADIGIKTIELRGAKIKVFKGKPHIFDADQKKPESKPLRVNPDSIYLKNLTGIRVDNVILKNNDIQLYSLEKDKQILSNKLTELEITEFYIRKYPDQEGLFYLDLLGMIINIKHEEFEMPGGDYRLSVDNLKYAIADSTLRINRFTFKPTWKDKYKMAAQWKFTKEIFDLSAKDITIHSLHQVKLIRDGKIYIDSIVLHNLEVDILKDKRYPFDESKRPLLPQQSLKKLKLPLYIGHINIDDSKLKYQEKTEGSKELMTIELGSLNADMRFITSVKDSILTKKSMTVKLRAKVNNKPKLKVDIDFPLYASSDIFYFAGSVDPTPLKIFNSAAFPAIGIKFIDGNLNGLHFKASASPTSSSGEMTMLYDKLATQVAKKDQVSKSKFFSWAANTVVKTSNPGKKGKTRVAVMSFDRVMYKGLGNFLWKTINSGIMNSILPTGKQVKEEDSNVSKKQVKKVEKEEKEEDPENNKKKKRKKKKKK